MEVPGGLPPDRDTYSCHQQPSHLQTLSGQHSITSSVGVSGFSHHQNERLSRPMSFDKMEQLVREMQDPEIGVPVRSQKLFLTSIPSAFMGYDLIEWMMERLTIEESEALSIANQLCLHGYFFPVNDSKTLVVKDDSSLYRFQSPYFWPWQQKAPDNVEYAIYLAKRSLRNKQRHGLEEYESEALANLHKNLKGKWEYIMSQAEEQVKLAKDRKKGDKIVGDSQERAFWRVYRPPPVQFTPLEPCPVPSRDRHGKPRKRTVDDLQREVDFLKASMGRTRMKMSQACECLIQYCETFSDYDFFIQPVLPSNPWVTEDTTFWQLNNTIVDIPTEKRVKRWSISIEELVSDPTGLQEFTAYLKKEYSHENIRFWIAVNDLRRSAHSQISRKVKEIYEEFLEPGAPCEINIDSKTMEKVQQNLKTPSRYTFDAAADHIFSLLLKKDCYPRFVRSEHYKSLLATGIQPAHKKRFFGFGVPKKKSSTAPPIPALLSQVPGPSMVPPPGSLVRRRGSDRSLSGSAHELAVSGVKDGSNKVPHSHSQSNLSDIPYSVVIYRGDMPSGGLPLPATQEDPSIASTSTSDAVHNANLKYPDVSKPMGESLEPTQEIATCAVCPWDTSEPVETAVSVSISPWDTDEPASISHGVNRTRNNSAIESGSSSSDISDLSDRMRRSCGIRQNTLDCELFGSKRLTASGTEHRRASMTIAPRMSDVQFSLRQPAPNTTKIQSPTSSSSVATATTPKSSIITTSVTPERPNFSQYSLNLSTTMSFEDREELHLLPATISEEMPEIYPSEQEEHSQQPSVLRIKSDEKYVENLQNDDDDDDNNSKTLKSKSNNELNLVKTNESDTFQPSSIGILETAPVTTSTITNVAAIAITTVATVITTATTTAIDATTLVAQFGTTPTITVEGVTGEEDSKSIKSTNEPGERSRTPSPPLPVPPLPVTIEMIQMEVQCFDDKFVSQEELSPTTEEYQECCPPDDFQYDLSTEGEILVSGCVAPAPTPAPSIAPLAEVEIDPPDDESEFDQSVQGANVEQPQQHPQQLKQEQPIEQPPIVEPKKKRKKRDSETKAEKEELPSAAATSEKKEVGNAVCPWEDDDGLSSTDAPFVKTYATLGYL